MTRLIVVAGVSGAGKSTVGALLAGRLGIPFLDGDALHPASNVAKMSAGVSLNDIDRAPWLRLVGGTLRDADGTGLVVACSALRRRYRDTIRAEAPATLFVLLNGSAELIGARLSSRDGHFMPANLLSSQLSTLERLEGDERGLTIPVDADPSSLAERISSEVQSENTEWRQSRPQSGAGRGH